MSETIKISESETEKKNSKPQSQELFEHRFEIAKVIGWTSVSYLIYPPSHFECYKNEWAAHRQLFKYQGKDVLVPHWFWDNHVLLFGKWK